MCSLTPLRLGQQLQRQPGKSWPAPAGASCLLVLSTAASHLLKGLSSDPTPGLFGIWATEILCNLDLLSNRLPGRENSPKAGDAL